jgi:hypothetical protein
MTEESTKQAIIVYRKQEAVYAHLMANLIAAFTDYKVQEWEEKHLLDNKPPSSQKIIFLGGSKEARSRHSGMNWKFNSHNMKYGWLGNQCAVDVDPLLIGAGREFLKYYKVRAKEFDNTAKSYSPNIGNNKIIDASIGFAPIVVLPVIVLDKLIRGNRQLVKYQYELLVREFVLDGGLKQFMEG